MAAASQLGGQLVVRWPTGRCRRWMAAASGQRGGGIANVEIYSARADWRWRWGWLLSGKPQGDVELDWRRLVPTRRTHRHVLPWLPRLWVLVVPQGVTWAAPQRLDGADQRWRSDVQGRSWRRCRGGGAATCKPWTWWSRSLRACCCAHGAACQRGNVVAEHLQSLSIVAILLLAFSGRRIAEELSPAF